MYDYIWKCIIFGIAFGKMHEFVDMEKWASFIWPLIRKSWILWYIRKFKDACHVMWEIDRKSLDKNEVENLINFVEVRLFKVFLKLPRYKLCIWK